MRPDVGLGIHPVLPRGIGVLNQTLVAVVAGLEVDGGRGELLGFGAWRRGLLGQRAHSELGGRACGASGGVVAGAVEAGCCGAHLLARALWWVGVGGLWCWLGGLIWGLRLELEYVSGLVGRGIE